MKQPLIPILMYHRFITHIYEDSNADIYISIKNLEKQFEFLKKHNFTTLTFSDLKNINFTKQLNNNKYIIITVDDGYIDNYYLLFPLLKKYNFKAVIYVVTGESYNKWDVENVNTQKIALMNKQQLTEMVDSGLVEIGGHTLTHPYLSNLNYKDQYIEIQQNKLYLEQELKTKIVSFAYPYGDFNKYSKNIAQQLGYEFAVVTTNGYANFHDELYQIKRIPICPWDNTFMFHLRIFCFYRKNIIYSCILKLLNRIKKYIFFIHKNIILYFKRLI